MEKLKSTLTTQGRISPNMTVAEATKSITAEKKGIDNSVACSATLLRMKYVSWNIFEVVREKVCNNKPLAATSFYRSSLLNKEIGGADNSQHKKGEAIDIDAQVFGNSTNAEIFYYIKNNLNFDQLIWEFGDSKEPAWIHVSLKVNGGNRGEVLKAKREKGVIVYIPFKP